MLSLLSPSLSSPSLEAATADAAARRSITSSMQMAVAMRLLDTQGLQVCRAGEMAWLSRHTWHSAPAVPLSHCTASPPTSKHTGSAAATLVRFMH